MVEAGAQIGGQPINRTNQITDCGKVRSSRNLPCPPMLETFTNHMGSGNSPPASLPTDFGEHGFRQPHADRLHARRM
jgi:hypothetical protein